MSWAYTTAELISRFFASSSYFSELTRLEACFVGSDDNGFSATRFVTALDQQESEAVITDLATYCARASTRSSYVIESQSLIRGARLYTCQNYEHSPSDAFAPHFIGIADFLPLG